jgi:hypothetical protein
MAGDRDSSQLQSCSAKSPVKGRRERPDDFSSFNETAGVDGQKTPGRQLAGLLGGAAKAQAQSES